MAELLTAFGLMLMIEGISYALFPDGMKRLMAQILNMPAQTIRAFGLAFAVTGFLFVAFVKSF